MSNITLTIPNDDHIALRAFGKALEEMALAHGAEPRKTVGELSYKLNIDTSEATAALERLNDVITEHPHVEIDTTTQQVESLAALDNDLPIITVNATCHALSNEELHERGFDSTGTPWDERIHSTSKALNADGTWRLRRKPKDMDETEWAAFVESVKGEISERAIDEYAGSINVALTTYGEELDAEVTPPTEDLCVDEGCDHHGTPHICVTPEPSVTPPGDDFHTDEQTVAGIPPLPVPPPVVVAPPVPVQAALSEGIARYGDAMSELAKNDGDMQWDFPHLMTFLTERHGKIDVATVNTLLAQDGMSSVQELNAHPDKIGPFVARVKAHLGE